MTDAEINEAVARALGTVCTNPNGHVCSADFIIEDGRVRGYVDGSFEVMDWATSLDACFRDLVPEAEERGWTLTITRDSFEGLSSWGVDFDDEVGPGGIEGAGSESPSRALCLAWLKTKEAA